jgi:ribosomal protein L37AE/L43A
MLVHINRPRIDKADKHRSMCPDCKKRTTKIGFFQEWYGWTVTCLGCGRKWQDGEWMPLGFYRTARQDNIDRAKKRWKEYQRRVTKNG